MQLKNSNSEIKSCNLSLSPLLIFLDIGDIYIYLNSIDIIFIFSVIPNLTNAFLING